MSLSFSISSHSIHVTPPPPSTTPHPSPQTDYLATLTQPPCPPAARRSVSSLAVERRYNRGLLGAAGLRDGGPHGSLLHVVVVVMVVHVVAGGG